MSELLDAAAALVLAAVFFVVGTAAGPPNGTAIGVVGAASAGYVGARVGSLRRRVDDLEARVED